MTIAQSYTADDKQDLNPAHLSRSVISVTPQNFPLSPVLFMPKWQTIQVLPERTWQVCPFFLSHQGHNVSHKPGAWRESMSNVKSKPTWGSVRSLSCVQLCDPMDCSTPGFPVHYQLPELTQTPVHYVGDAIQPSHPLSSPSPPASNLSQHQGLFQ